MLKTKFYFEDMVTLKIGEMVLNMFDYITIVDIDEKNFAISVVFTKINKYGLVFIKHFACPIKAEVIE